MKEIETSCCEAAKIQVPWAGKIFNYCPAHANKMVLLAKAMDAPLQVQLLHNPLNMISCENSEPLTDEEKELNKSFTTNSIIS